MKSKYVVLIVIIVAVLFLGFVFVTRENEAEPISRTATSTATSSDIATSTDNEVKTFSSAQVSTHATSTDCWIIINGSVYNVTSFLVKHPGGRQAIIRYCGKDATTAFETRNATPARPHSQTARNLLPEYFIGTLTK